ncbi:uncharacterized protein LOC126734950 [Anthonomus grandis grandis]|uniref:uncharacterized protein LOC126734950 n=1 Tax=Anthonomus grandis grandis TaxID=2921223 RepID=UPI002165CAF6|nr:uncharacterized protein LOC126734950 [Anthonomus grandis grandis]
MAANVTKKVGLFKRLWNDVPEIVGSAAFAIVGLGLTITANILYIKKDGDNRPYKPFYTVYRHDDPRVSTLKTSCEETSSV